MINPQDEIKSVKKQITYHRRRLNILQEKKAIRGINVDPEVILEIEDIQAEIEQLDARLQSLAGLKGLIQVTLDRKFSPELLGAAQRAFASVLNIPVEQVQVAFVREGSVVLLVQTPVEVLDLLSASTHDQFEPYRIREMMMVDTLANANLSGAKLDQLDLFEFDLSGANLSNASLNQTTLIGANLSQANLSQAVMFEANLEWADLRLAWLDGTTKIDNKWRLVWDIVNGALLNLNLRGVDLSETDLRKARLELADLRDSDLRRSDLSTAKLYEANLSRANLGEALLRGTDMRHTRLSKANLRDAWLDETTKIDDKWRLVWNIVNYGAAEQDLRSIDLSDADLTGATLVGTDLTGAKLNYTLLQEANVSGANLTNADLTGADLTGIISDEYTRWPWKSERERRKILR